MSKKEEKKYRVTSPIKRGGKKYEVDESILLTEEEAQGLHVVPFDAPKEEAESEAAAVKSSPSMGLSATAAVKVIEQTDLDDLKGFVVTDDEGGNEDRVTVKKAWAAKQEPIEEKDSKK
ncbi:hypothetical protein [Gracilimonas tropica]|uniref:hypothetical protein n=1 Tax=Gracilimonas tropica TaxID=454600 RepID=UPI00036A0D8D|nr:hypothetical protein [Gracilimonas tropica]